MDCKCLHRFSWEEWLEIENAVWTPFFSPPHSKSKGFSFFHFLDKSFLYNLLRLEISWWTKIPNPSERTVRLTWTLYLKSAHFSSPLPPSPGPNTTIFCLKRYSSYWTSTSSLQSVLHRAEWSFETLISIKLWFPAPGFLSQFFSRTGRLLSTPKGLRWSGLLRPASHTLF